MENSVDSVDKPDAMCSFGPFNIGMYLLGNRAAIEKLIACRLAVIPAGLLVGTAALCREYDAVSILHSPGDLAAPFMASLALAAFLYFWLLLMPWPKKSPSNPGHEPSLGFVTFLSAYWMTAPLAWVYAIPVEVMLEEYKAIVCNLTFLSVVSIWRVALFSRFVSVWYRVPYWVSLSWVTLPCCVIAAVAMTLNHLNIVGIMGGIRLTVSEQAMISFQQGAQNVALFCGGLALLGAIGSYFAPRLTWTELGKAKCDLSKGIWFVPLIACVPLLGGGIYFQPKFFRAAVVDFAIRNGQFSIAIDCLEQSGALDHFPVRWDPSPAPRKPIPDMAGLILAVDGAKPELWITDLLLHDAEQWLLKEQTYAHFDLDLTNEDTAEFLAHQISEEQLAEVLHAAQILSQLPSEVEAAAKSRMQLAVVLQEALSLSEKQSSSKNLEEPDD